MPAATHPETVHCWDVFEVTIEGPSEGNPFTDIELSAAFTHKHRSVEVDGFYDGGGTYRVRFMPDAEGEWTFRTSGSVPELDGAEGAFTCVEPAPGSHGPVHVEDKFHFAYADGTPYHPVGTTCYAWVHQGDEMEEQTLATLAEAPFNKLRMCVFPKWFVYNRVEPEHYPFRGSPEAGWDFTRFNPDFWRHFEKRLGQLTELGIEADLILFHPYDRGHWGFDRMDADSDDRYLRYAVARLAAFRNVWWSMANEWDFMDQKRDADWHRLFRIAQESDPYDHPRSIHNGGRWYDQSRSWVTHLSVQDAPDDVHRWRKQYGKPVVVDECKYEGDIPHGWGDITAQELVRRFWVGTVRGGYVGHGETYLHPQDILWWSHGGVLRGESPPRIAFLRQIIEGGPPGGLDPVEWTGWDVHAAGKGNDYCLFYFGNRQPARRKFSPPEGIEYKVDVIDTWEMTVKTLEGTCSGEFTIELPAKPYIAVRLRRA